MSGWKARGETLARVVLFETAAVGMWAFIVNREVLHWTDGVVKTACTIGLAVTLGGLALLASRRPGRVAPGLAILVIGVFFAGELRRAVLRDAYGASVGSPQAIDPASPVTTTDLVLSRYVVDVPRLTRPRLRVAHVTDVHMTEELPTEYFDAVHTAVREATPDVIVLTGDYISRLDRLHAFRTWVEKLPVAPLGAYATLGNHDYWTERPEWVRDALRDAGVQVIGGTCVDPSEPSDVRICGTDAPWGAGLDGAPADDGVALVIALTHTPDQIYDLARLGADAVFAGHTHGGQLRIPGLGALIVPSRYGRRFDRGHFAVESAHLFVSAGVGADAPPLRLWCPPEIVVVDFVGRRVG